MENTAKTTRSTFCRMTSINPFCCDASISSTGKNTPAGSPGAPACQPSETRGCEVSNCALAITEITAGGAGYEIYSGGLFGVFSALMDFTLSSP
jgi:hypothetical protein